MKKILIISYYAPPSAKAGAHRAYSMAEFLPQTDWTPVFVAPYKYSAKMVRQDNKLLNVFEKHKVYRVDFFYPFNRGKIHLFARIVRRLWEEIWMPDGRCSWNLSLKKFLPEIIVKEKPNIIFITSAPFSTFLLATWLKKKYSIPIVLDYRDPWIGNPYIHRGYYIKKKVAIEQEKQIIQNADLITTASYRIIDFIKEHSGSYVANANFWGFPYGFNSEKFDNLKQQKQNNDKIVCTFAGSVHGDIDIHTILKGIRTVIDTNRILKSKLIINCFGTLFGIAKNINKTLLDKYGLSDNVKIKDFKPYEEFLVELKNSDFLILPHGDSEVAKVLFPTKFFDYLGVRKPILYWGGKGQVWETIEKCNAGICSLPTSEQIANSLIRTLDNTENFFDRPDELKKFYRKNIFYEFVEQLEKLI